MSRAIRTFLNGRVEVTVGDITRERVDVIVNAANSSLMGGGGVDGAIHRAGGHAILDACRELRRTTLPAGLPTGQAVATTAGDLHAQHVIHTAGPVWHGGNDGEADLLASCYTSSLEIASGLGAGSVAIPAISTGIYGYPATQAAAVASRSIATFLEYNELPELVRLVFFSETGAATFTRCQVFNH